MTDSETEDEILLRIETALRKIGTLARPARPDIDRSALLTSLDMIITRLRNGLDQPKPGSHTTE
jgi:hypothetical protein